MSQDEKIRVLITVKTYPTLSAKYDELVCTAGFREDGTWIRLYPIPFRMMDFDRQYKKYQWIELDVKRKTDDFRKESYSPVNPKRIRVVDEIKPDRADWLERRKACLKNVYTNKAKLIKDAKDKNKYTSLATFKPRKITNFICKPVERFWDEKKLKSIMAKRQQLNIFSPTTREEQLTVVDKLPYKFSYEFTDDEGVSSNLMIEDWEIGALYWNALKKCNGDEAQACEKVREKYLDNFVKTKDVYLFLGTTLLHHNTGRNPFVIIGVFYPKYPTAKTGTLF